MDLSPIQPDFVPENVYFAVDDFEDEWVHPENSLDYIHIRNALFSARDRAALFQRAYRYVPYLLSLSLPHHASCFHAVPPSSYPLPTTHSPLESSPIIPLPFASQSSATDTRASTAISNQEAT